MTTSAPPLTDEQITLILTSWSVSHVDMARQLGLHRERVRSIRFGESNAKRCPHLERWPAYRSSPTCTRCVNWRPLPAESPSCAFGFPDPITESTRFARECLHYNPA